MAHVRFNGKKLDPATIRALVSGTLVAGSKPSVWWNRQSLDFRNSFMDTMRQSMRNGESLTTAITRVVGGTVDGVTVPGIMKTTKAKAGALAATAQSAVTNEAALKTFQANNDVIKAVSQISTLDNRTSDICIAYSGQTWDVNTLQPVMGGSLPFNGGPPRHFNCRSRLRPVTMSFKELGIDADEIPAGTRASMDGQVPADITFNQFLKKKSKGFQDDLLGPKRAQLWRNDDITLTQLVDMRGNPMTIAQLEQKIGIKPPVDPLKRKTPTKKVVDDDIVKQDPDPGFKAALEREKATKKKLADENKKLVKDKADADKKLVAEKKETARLKDEADAKKLAAEKEKAEAIDEVIQDQVNELKPIGERFEFNSDIEAHRRNFSKKWVTNDVGDARYIYDPSNRQWMVWRVDSKGRQVTNVVFTSGKDIAKKIAEAASKQPKPKFVNLGDRTLNHFNPGTRERFLRQTLTKKNGFIDEDFVIVKKQIKELIDSGKAITPDMRDDIVKALRAERRKLTEAAKKSAVDIEAERKAVKEAADAAKSNTTMTTQDAIDSAIKGEFKKAGELPEVIRMHVQSFADAPSYVKAGVGRRKSLSVFQTDYNIKQHGGAFYRDMRNEIWIHKGSHPNANAFRAVWRHEYGHSIDYGLADDFYRLIGKRPDMDKFGAPIISGHFNKQLLRDSTRAQKWKKSQAKARLGTDLTPQSKYEDMVRSNMIKGGETKASMRKHYAAKLKKHGINFDDLDDIILRNAKIRGKELAAYTREEFLPNLLSSLETGRIETFLNVITKRGMYYEGGADWAMFSDYFSAITKNKIRGNFGHSNSYYGSRQHGRTGKHKEAFANAVAMLGSKDSAFYLALLRSWGTDQFLIEVQNALKLLEKASG